jgi:hypothetical protein
MEYRYGEWNTVKRADQLAGASKLGVQLASAVQRIRNFGESGPVWVRLSFSENLAQYVYPSLDST